MLAWGETDVRRRKIENDNKRRSNKKKLRKEVCRWWVGYHREKTALPREKGYHWQNLRKLIHHQTPEEENHQNPRKLLKPNEYWKCYIKCTTIRNADFVSSMFTLDKFATSTNFCWPVLIELLSTSSTVKSADNETDLDDDKASQAHIWTMEDDGSQHCGRKEDK